MTCHRNAARRQSCRGRKSGMARRYATRDRDARIARWVNRGRYTVRQVARHAGLSPSSVSRIASRARGGAGFWRGRERAWPVRRPLLRQPSLSTPSAFSPSPIGSRNTSIFTSLTSWTGLRAVQRLSDRAILHEAERLNQVFSEPMKPAQVKKVARSVCRRRRLWSGGSGRPHQGEPRWDRTCSGFSDS